MSTPGVDLTEAAIALPDGGRMQAAIALPAVAGPVPGVLVIHEPFGLTEFIRDVCRRFATHGYAAIAPDLLSVGPRLSCLVRLMRDHAHRDTRTATSGLLDAAYHHLAAHPRVDGERMAAIGFCMGGGFALTYGLTGKVRASAVNYGLVPGTADALAGSCPIVASYGGADPALRGAGDRLEQHLTVNGVPHDVKSYPGVGHGFLRHTPPRPIVRVFAAPLRRPLHLGHHPQAAADAWQRIFAFFDTHVRNAA